MINMPVTELRKVSVSDMKNLKTVFNTVTAVYKYSLLNRDNLTQPIQMQLSKKQKNFSEFFFLAFFKSTLNFQNFLKKMTLITDVFPKLRTRKNVIR